MLSAFPAMQYVKFGAYDHGGHRLARVLPFAVAVVGVVFSLLFFVEQLSAAPLRVRVRGTAKLVARASRDQAPGQAPGVSNLVLSGTLSDDAGDPLALQSVTIRVSRETDPHDASVAEAMRAAHGCDRAPDPAQPAQRGARGPAA